ncbi:MAG: class II fructose-bisphosphate aldolase [Clostridiales bacterium]|nr:class II fructose-bisphosphate aldolase [Clostridiales bacterium]
MPYVNCKEMILKAQKEKYAVPAFNAENLEMAQAIVSAAVEENSPVIIQTTKPTAAYLGMEEMAAIVSALAKKAPIPVALHLDHADKFDIIMQAIKAGYTSVMVDGSALPLKENIAISAKVAEIAREMDISTEGELGRIGGKEDDVNVKNAAYVVPSEAKEFAEKTGVDFFAVAIGTAHGFYKGEPHLAFDVLAEVAKLVSTPLVLHGGSGIEEAKIKKAISLGMSKVNFATELRDNFTKSVREALKDETIIDPKKYLGVARAGLKSFCIQKIRMCGSSNKAN